MTDSKSNILSRLALLVTAIVWGSSLVVISSTADFFNPNFLLGLRFSIAFILLCIIFAKKLKLLNKGYLLNGGIIGFMLFLAYSSQTFGVTVAGGLPGRSGFLSASYCVIVPFLAWAVNHTKPDKFNIISAVLCVVGIALTCIQELIAGASVAISAGDYYALLSGFLFAGHIVTVSKFAKGKDTILITILQFGFAAIFSIIATIVFEDNSATVWTKESIVPVLYLSVICTAIALLFQNIGQKHTDPSAVAIILGLESVFSIIFSVIFRGESVDICSLLGFVLIFIAIIVSETKLKFLNKEN